MNSGVSFSVNRALLFEQYVIMSTPIFTRNNLYTQLPIGFHVASNSNKLGKSIWLDKFGEAAVKTPSNSLCFFLSSLSRLASSPLRYLILPSALAIPLGIFSSLLSNFAERPPVIILLHACCYSGALPLLHSRPHTARRCPPLALFSMFAPAPPRSSPPAQARRWMQSPLLTTCTR